MMINTAVTVEYHKAKTLWFGSLSLEDRRKHPEIRGLMIADRIQINLIKKAPKLLNELLMVQGLPCRSWDITYKKI